MILNWGPASEDYFGLQTLIRTWLVGGGAAAVVPATARGDIDYDQIRVSARTGNGNQLLTWSTPAPALHTSTGVAGQIAFDSSGNIYFCYATDQWAKIGAGGYSNSF
jgi:hypothetical protein